jgi:hypothetical protein
VEVGTIRHWYDIKIDEYYINIKVSTMESADNISSKIGLAYALTGKIDVSTKWDTFHEVVAETFHLNHSRNRGSGCDYYFLIIDKNDIEKSFWTSLKRIETLKPNGNNLPFQCVWNKNRHFSSRSDYEAEEYLLRQYLASLRKKESSLAKVGVLLDELLDK